MFPLLRDKIAWLGVNVNKSYEFRVPGHYKGFIKIDNGNKYDKGPGVSWYTNLSHDRHSCESIYLNKTYCSKTYPKYENFDAIHVDRVANIPKDYNGIMGVPISTFLANHNPKQFEIVGYCGGNLFRQIPGSRGLSTEFVRRYYAAGKTGVIKAGHPALGYYGENNEPIIPFGRILIKPTVR